VGQDNIIELNGKRYDAISGALLGDGHIKTAPAKRAPAQAHRGRTIDGFMRSNKPGTLAPTVVKPAQPAKTIAAVQPDKLHSSIGKNMDIHRVTKVVQPHKPERSKTLMRHAVNKPKTTPKPTIKTTAPTEMMARPVSTIAKPLEKKLSVSSVDPIRLARANQIARSHHIRRFSRAQHQQQRNVSAASFTAPQTTRPAARQSAPAQKLSHSIALAKAKQQLAAQQNPIDIFEAALAHAVSHEQMPQQYIKRRHPHRRLVNALAGVGAFLVIGGFIAYLNMPAIELQFASVRAGFHAEMPGYRPTGYALDGGVKSSAGQVAMTFRSGDSSFQITQESSDWDSATLLDQKTDQLGAPVQTVQSKGRIIYIYGNNSATWVNGGIRYEISGSSSLNADDLVSLATSM
jgi:hypothetical protein